MMQEAKLVNPETVRRPRRKMIRLGEKMLNRLQFVVGNLDKRLPFAKYRLQDRLIRFGLERLHVKGVKFNGKNHWREVTNRTELDEFGVWFMCRYGLTGKVKRMKDLEVKNVKVGSSESGEPPLERKVVSGEPPLEERSLVVSLHLKERSLVVSRHVKEWSLVVSRHVKEWSLVLSRHLK
jgi:hypothetical protein